jgi:hypothetical protein
MRRRDGINGAPCASVWVARLYQGITASQQPEKPACRMVFLNFPPRACGRKLDLSA